jgi:signal peptidase I
VRDADPPSAADVAARKGDRRRFILWSVVGLLALLVLAKFFVADLYTIPQDGMAPGLPAGSRFIGMRHPYKSVQDVRRGDVVVFTLRDGNKTYQYVWRVIALPGDTVGTAGAAVQLNGKALPQQPVRTAGAVTIFTETNGGATYEIASDAAAARPAPDVLVTVPPNQLFLLGDNRHHAADSRVHGTAPFDAVVARARRR